MQSIPVEALTFEFDDEWIALEYEKMAFHIKQFQNVCGGSKVVDIVAVDQGVCCWLIEVKDYRRGHQMTEVEVAKMRRRPKTHQKKLLR